MSQGQGQLRALHRVRNKEVPNECFGFMVNERMVFPKVVLFSQSRDHIPFISSEEGGGKKTKSLNLQVKKMMASRDNYLESSSKFLSGTRLQPRGGSCQ